MLKTTYKAGFYECRIVGTAVRTFSKDRQEAENHARTWEKDRSSRMKKKEPKR